MPGTNVPRISIDFASTSDLINCLQTPFGDPDPTGTARIELAKLRQGKLDFSSDLSEFTRIMSVLNYDPPAKMDALEAGMFSKLREGLVYNIRPHPPQKNMTLGAIGFFNWIIASVNLRPKSMVLIPQLLRWLLLYRSPSLFPIRITLMQWTSLTVDCDKMYYY